MRLPLGGGTPEQMLPEEVQVGGIALDAGRFYWTDSDAGTVSWMPTEGGAVTTLVTGMDAPQALTLDDVHVYWVDHSKDDYLGAVHRVPTAGGAVEDIADRDNLGGTMITTDATHVYWSGHRVWRREK